VRWRTRTSDPLLVSYLSPVSHRLRITIALRLIAVWVVHKCLTSSQRVFIRP